MHTFDNDVSLLYYLKIIKTLRAKETDLRLEIIIFFLGFLFSFYFINHHQVLLNHHYVVHVLHEILEFLLE